MSGKTPGARSFSNKILFSGRGLFEQQIYKTVTFTSNRNTRRMSICRGSAGAHSVSGKGRF